MEVDEQSLHKERFGLHCILKYFLFTINVLVWIVGAVFIGVGSWAHYEKNKYSSIKTLSADPAILLIVVGVLMFTVAFCGCIGFLRENKILLKIRISKEPFEVPNITFHIRISSDDIINHSKRFSVLQEIFLYMVFLTIIFLIEIVAGFIAFFFVEQTKSKVTAVVTHAMEHYRDDADLQNLIDSLQQNFRCCGGYSYHDWNANKHFNCSVATVESCGVPFSCCRTDKINTQCGFGVRRKKTEAEARAIIYTQGCVVSFTNWFNENLLVIGGLAFGFALIQLFGIFGASSIIRDIDDIKETQRENHLHPDF